MAAVLRFGRRRVEGNHAGRHRLVVRVDVGPAPRDARLLVHFDPEAVAGAVPERVAEAGRGERVARRGVDVEARSAGRHRGDRVVVRGAHRVVHLSHARPRSADRDGAREVDAV